MFISKRLVGFNNLGKIGFHQLCNYIDFLKFLQISWLQDRMQLDNVLMLEKPEDLKLSKCSLREYLMFEGLLDFLNGDETVIFVLCLLVLGCDHNTVRSGTYGIYNIILLGQLKPATQHFIDLIIRINWHTGAISDLLYLLIVFRILCFHNTLYLPIYI